MRLTIGSLALLLVFSASVDLAAFGLKFSPVGEKVQTPIQARFLAPVSVPWRCPADRANERSYGQSDEVIRVDSDNIARIGQEITPDTGPPADGLYFDESIGITIRNLEDLEKIHIDFLAEGSGTGTPPPEAYLVYQFVRGGDHDGFAPLPVQSKRGVGNRVGGWSQKFEFEINRDELAAIFSQVERNHLGERKGRFVMEVCAFTGDRRWVQRIGISMGDKVDIRAIDEDERESISFTYTHSELYTRQPWTGFR